MAETIDWPPKRSRRRRGRLFLLAAIAIVLLSGGTALSYYVDALWFDSLGYIDVFWKTLNLQAAAFVAFSVITFLVIYGSFLAFKPANFGEAGSGGTIIINGQPVQIPVGPALRLIAPRRVVADRAHHGRRVDDRVADARARLVWPHGGRGHGRSDLRKAAHVLSVLPAGVEHHLRLADDAGGRGLWHRDLLSRGRRGRSRAWRDRRAAWRRARRTAMARVVARVCGPPADDRRPRLSGTVRQSLQRPDDLHGRELHGRPRHVDRIAAGVDGPRRRRNHRVPSTPCPRHGSGGSSRPPCRPWRFTSSCRSSVGTSTASS